ncbi:5648_t:CDS:2 [Funneliformis geosporum]|uniref:5648_t:CDS:1 n=1 Tax=Funneliformis geosporum TaxID=1117311 RepID=A0A9W4SPR9_9GLOM|nr:5648_t:CDS:2 [Funneliformis geosporum]
MEIKEKEEEIDELQVEIQNFQKFIKEAGEKVYGELNKSEQIKNLEKGLHYFI